jgi:hypothetical protein
MSFQNNFSLCCRPYIPSGTSKIICVYERKIGNPSLYLCVLWTHIKCVPFYFDLLFLHLSLYSFRFIYFQHKSSITQYHGLYALYSSFVSYSQLGSSIKHLLLKSLSLTFFDNLSSTCTQAKCFCSPALFWVSWMQVIIMIYRSFEKPVQDLYSRASTSTPYARYWVLLKSISNTSAQKVSYRKF